MAATKGDWSSHDNKRYRGKIALHLPGEKKKVKQATEKLAARIGVRRPSEAVHAAMLTALIGVDALLKPQVGRVVVTQDGLGLYLTDLGLPVRQQLIWFRCCALLLEVVEILLSFPSLKTGPHV